MKTSNTPRAFGARNWSRWALAILASSALALTACAPDQVTTPEETPPVDSPTETETPPGEPTGMPEPTDTAEETQEPSDPPGDALEQPTWDNAPVPEDLPDEAGEWVQVNEFEEWGQAALTPCQADEIPVETILGRGFHDSTGEWEIITVTLGFADAEEASAAHEVINEWYLSCEQRLGGEYEEVLLWQEPGDIPVSDELQEAAGDIQPVALTGSTVTLVREDSDIGAIGNGTVAQVGNRLTWVISHTAGMDQNCGLEPDGDMEQCHVFEIANDVGLRLVQ